MYTTRILHRFLSMGLILIAFSSFISCIVLGVETKHAYYKHKRRLKVIGEYMHVIAVLAYMGLEIQMQTGKPQQTHHFLPKIRCMRWQCACDYD